MKCCVFLYFCVLMCCQIAINAKNEQVSGLRYPDHKNWIELDYVFFGNHSGEDFPIHFVHKDSERNYVAQVFTGNMNSGGDEIDISDEQVYNTSSNNSIYYIPLRYLQNGIYFIGSWFEASGTSECNSDPKYYAINDLLQTGETDILHVIVGNKECITIPQQQTELVWPSGYVNDTYCKCSTEDSMEFEECFRKSFCDTVYSIYIDGKMACFTNCTIAMNDTVVFLQSVKKSEDSDGQVITILDISRFIMYDRPPPTLTFNYDGFYFSPTYKTISWNRAEECIPPISYILIKALTETNFTTTNLGDVLTVNVSVNELELNYFNIFKYHIEVMSENSICQISDTSVQISPELNTINQGFNPAGSFCVQPSSFHLAVIWPKSNNEMDGNCFCNIWREIASCSCIEHENYFEVVNIVGNSGIEICWNNIKNNTKINFVDEISTFNFVFPAFNQRFLLSYTAVLGEVPSPPNITRSRNEFLCYTDIYAGHLEVKVYEVSVVDNTGFKYSFQQNKTDYITCGNITSNKRSLFSPLCGPWSVNVTSVNEIGPSAPATFEIIEDGAECSCFNNNVDFLLQYMNTSMNIICKLETKYNYFESIQLNFTLMTKSQFIEELTGFCPGMIHFPSLKPDTGYQLDMKWKSIAGSVCSTDTFYFTTFNGIEGNYSSTVIILLAVLASIILVLILIFIFTTCLVCTKMFSKKKHLELVVN